MSVPADISRLVGLDPNKPVLDTAGFASVIAKCLVSLSPNAIVWKTASDPFIGDQDRARITLDLFSLRGLGWEERRRVYALPGYPANAFVTVMLGNRTLIITARADVYDKDAQAAELLDQIRSRMIDDDIIEALNAINIAFVSSHPATRVDYVVDERVVNCAVADFTFAGVAQHVSGIAIDGNVPVPFASDPTWIETIDPPVGDLKP